MKVLVCGGRMFRDRNWLFAGLDLLHTMSPITEIIEGGAVGADTLAYEWAYAREVRCTIVPAEWERYSAGLKLGQKNPAGIIRNSEMLKLGPAIVLATPGGAGTAHMVKIAKAHGVRVVMLDKMPVVSSRKDPLGSQPGGLTATGTR